MKNVVTLKTTQSKTILEEFARDNPESVKLIQSRGLDGASAELIAIVSMAGVTIKSLLDVITAIIKRNDVIEISHNGTTIKGVSIEEAKELLTELKGENQNAD